MAVIIYKYEAKQMCKKNSFLKATTVLFSRLVSHIPIELKVEISLLISFSGFAIKYRDMKSVTMHFTSRTNLQAETNESDI